MMTNLGILLGTILRIAVDASGPYEVPADAVKDAGLALAQCDLYGVACDTATPTAVPIVLRKDGGFEFLASARTRHSKNTVFVLRPPPGPHARGDQLAQ